MHRCCPLLLLVACGPTLDDGSATTDQATGSQTNASTSSNSSSVSTSGSTGNSDASTTAPQDASTGSSSGAPEIPFEDDFVEDSWLCASEEDPFVLNIESYSSPQMLTGTICLNSTSVEDPRLWELCAELSSHPLGGGAHLWIFAQIEHDDGSVQIISAGLTYDVPSDTMMGYWSGPGIEDGSPLACERI